MNIEPLTKIFTVSTHWITNTFDLLLTNKFKMISWDQWLFLFSLLLVAAYIAWIILVSIVRSLEESNQRALTYSETHGRYKLRGKRGGFQAEKRRREWKKSLMSPKQQEEHAKK